MRVALDTNLLAYAEGVGDERRCRLAQEVIARLNVADALLPTQTLGELARVLLIKAGRDAQAVREAVALLGRQLRGGRLGLGRHAGSA